MIASLAMFGGLLTLLILIHFTVDFLFQSHDEAMRKTNEPWIRARHCAVYTCGFLPLLIWCSLPFWQVLGAVGILFGSHMVEDSYWPVFLWAKHIRKPPCMVDPVRTERGTFVPADPKAGFMQFVMDKDNALGKILLIAVDQIVHIWFLMPIVYMLLRRQ